EKVNKRILHFYVFLKYKYLDFNISPQQYVLIRIYFENREEGTIPNFFLKEKEK
ncbi:hypothetical protein JOD96_004235, partial [Flavobacterium sp. 1355]|nr:hypothetical protein [Flavobacterium sp. 1355]